MSIISFAIHLLFEKQNIRDEISDLSVTQYKAFHLVTLLWYSSIFTLSLKVQWCSGTEVLITNEKSDKNVEVVKNEEVVRNGKPKILE